MVQVYKGIDLQDTFENFEWNFRDIWIQKLVDFGDTCSKCYMMRDTFPFISRDTGYLEQRFQGLIKCKYVPFGLPDAPANFQYLVHSMK